MSELNIQASVNNPGSKKLGLGGLAYRKIGWQSYVADRKADEETLCRCREILLIKSSGAEVVPVCPDLTSYRRALSFPQTLRPGDVRTMSQKKLA